MSAPRIEQTILAHVEQAGFATIAALAEARLPCSTSPRELIVCASSIGDIIVMMPYVAQAVRDSDGVSVELLAISRYGRLVDNILPAVFYAETLEVATVAQIVKSTVEMRRKLRSRKYESVRYVSHATEEVLGRLKKLALLRVIVGMGARCAGFARIPGLMTRRESEAGEGAGVVHQALQPFETARIQPLISRESVLAFLAFTEREKQNASTLLSHARDVGGPVVGMYVGARVARKAWGTDRYVTVAKELADAGYTVAFVGGTEDRAAADAVIRASGIQHAIQWCGATTLRESVLVYGALSLVVGNDAAPIHIGALGGAPVVSIFCQSGTCRDCQEPIAARASRSIRPAWPLRRPPGVVRNRCVVPAETVRDAAFELLSGATGHV